MEKWKDIVGWEGLYQVSNLGRVVSKERRTVDSLGRKRLRHRKLLKVATDRYGYNYVVMRKGKMSQTKKVHRLVMQAFVGESKLQVNHLNLIKTDNRLDNLEYCSQSENLMHRRKHGKPFKKYYKKLNAEACDFIVLFRALGWKNKKIASLFNIHPNSIYKVVAKYQSPHQSCRSA